MSFAPVATTAMPRSEPPEPVQSPLLEDLLGVGGVAQEYHGVRLVRHFGDPRGEYRAATEGAAVFDRSHRTRLTVSGRAPRQMLDGVLTGALPGPPRQGSDDVLHGTATYHAVLTPKGKMISDAWALLPEGEEEQGFLLDVPVAGRAPLLQHLAKFLPPRFARVTDVSDEWASISVVGPNAATQLSESALGSLVEPAELVMTTEGDWLKARPEPDGLIVARTTEVWPAAWTVYGSTRRVRALWQELVEHGVTPAGLGVWSTLRVEAGRPVFGTDMDERTLPPEAGIVERAIDQTKGCYTGQEVIVRIRDRGHVNRELRRLRLGDAPAPARGTELLTTDGSDRVVGEITSAVQSPRFGGAVVLAYVRRGVERVRIGDVEVDVPETFPEEEGAATP